MTGRILIGTDEAGYGPNLGPLTVAATAWSLPDGVEPQDLWDELTVCTHECTRNVVIKDCLWRIPRKSFRREKALESLEVAVLAFSRSHQGRARRSIDQLCRSLSMVSQAVPFSDAYRAEPWNYDARPDSPVDSSDDHISEWVRHTEH